MYEVERANLVSRRVMGADRYLATVRQQNQGVAQGEDMIWAEFLKVARVRRLKMTKS